MMSKPSTAQAIKLLREINNPGTAARNLQNKMDEIIHTWEDWCSKDEETIRNNEQLAIRERVRPFLEDLVHALTPGAPAIEADPIPSSMAGFELNQLLSEYMILRKTVQYCINEVYEMTKGEQEIIHDSIDKAMSRAAQEYAASKEAQLLLTIGEVERSNRDLENFAAVAAHDLKSPLGSITAFTELLDEKVRDLRITEVKDALDFIKSASDRMRNLIDRILEYAHITHKERVFQEIDLNTAFETATANLSSVIENKHVSVTHSSLPKVIGDQELLTQLFQNLISNGIKYNKSELPDVCAKCDEFNDYWIISVKDNGIGFDQKYADAVFVPYSRLHSRNEYQGSGLGLTTARRIAEIHNGTIWVESRVDNGSTFYIKLPKARL